MRFAKRLIAISLAAIVAALPGVAEAGGGGAPGLSPPRNLSDVRSPFISRQNLADVSQRAPTLTDDTPHGYNVNDLWCAIGACSQAQSVTAGAALWMPVITSNGASIGSALPLDIAGTSAAWAGGTVLLTRTAAAITLNKSIDVWRSSDQTTLTLGWVNGVADAAAADAFCAASWAAGGWCDVPKVYDQSYNIATGALNSNDAVQSPGWNVNSATVATGGTGCTNGTDTFTASGGTGVAATVSGVVSGGVLSGALTVVSQGAYAVLPANPVTITGNSCSVAPTINIGWTHRSPAWQTHTVNGQRPLNFSAVFTGGNPLSAGTYSGEWLSFPVAATNQYTHSVVAALQNRSPWNLQTSLYSLDPGANNYTFNLSQSANPPASIGYRSTAGTQVAHTSPAIVSVAFTNTTITYTENNRSSTIAQPLGNVAHTGGSIGSGVNSRAADYDLTAFMLFPVTLSATQITNIKSSLALATKTIMHAQTTLLVPVSDSITYSASSATSWNWPKSMQNRGLIPPVDVINLGYPGGRFSGGGALDFTAQFSNIFPQIYSASIPNIIVPIGLGTNDIGVGVADGPTTFARAQTLHGLVQALGSNVRTVAMTLTPRSTGGTSLCDATCQASMAAYNALVVANWSKPISAGGLGAAALCDLAGDPLLSQGYAALTAYLVGGIHPTDAMTDDMAATCAPVIAPLLR